MWTITDEQIEKIAEAIKQTKGKIVNNNASAKKAAASADAKDETQHKKTSSGSGNKNSSYSYDNTADSAKNADESQASPKQPENISSGNKQDTNGVMQICEDKEVDSLTVEKTNATEDQLYVELQKSNRLVNDNGISCSTIGEEKIELDNKNVDVEVCTKIKLTAFTKKGEGEKEKIDNSIIEWVIHKGADDEEYLDDLEYIINSSNLVGNEIEFAIPKEWGQRTIILKAIRTDLNVEVRINLYVKDHIAAAFYRLYTGEKEADNNPLFFENKTIEIKEKQGGIPKLLGFLTLDMLYHHQGVYKEDGTYYISVSTVPYYPSYIYMSGRKTGVIKMDEGVLCQYTHPGGIQVANGILAVGIEKYWPLLPVTTDIRTLIPGKHFGSVVCFYDISKTSPVEIKSIRLVLDKYHADNIENQQKKSTGEIIAQDKEILKMRMADGSIQHDLASALGIVYRKDKEDWLVAVRGIEGKILFYIITEKNKIYSINKIKGSLDGVGDFQNVNLLQDENNEVYLFGMGNETDVESSWVEPCYYLKSTEREDDWFGFDNQDFADDPLIVYKNDKIFWNLENLNLEYGMPTLVFRDILYFGVEDSPYQQYNRDGQVGVIRWFDYAENKGPTSSGCRIFRVVIKDNVLNLQSVWINEKGVLNAMDYNSAKKKENKLTFECGKGKEARFHWASCLTLYNPEADTATEGKAAQGFKGRFTLSAIGAAVNTVGKKDKKKNIINHLMFYEKR